MNRCYYLERQKKGNLEKVKGVCYHSQSLHHEGVCWNTTTNKEGKLIECQCAHHKGNVKPFSITNEMKVEVNDFMIHKECKACETLLLIRVDSKKCNLCNYQL